MLHSDLRYPGWVQGWGVVDGGPPSWKFAGVFETLYEARTAAADAGPGYESTGVATTSTTGILSEQILPDRRC